MKIKWLGHACFLITPGNGIKIITDPYESGYRGVLNHGPITEISDIVTISHQHGDHNYIKGLQGTPSVVRESGQHNIKGIQITGVSCYHDKVSGRERGENIIFCFSIEDINICNCGDLGHPLNHDTLRSLGRVDILLIPTGGPPATLELKEAASLWGKLKPNIIIPIHYRNEKCSFPKYGECELTKMKLKPVRASKNEVCFTSSSLPSSQILILETAL